MTAIRPAVLPLTELRGSDRARVGGKAAMLGELLRRGFPVPDAVVLTVPGSLSAETFDALDQARLRLGGTVAVRSSAPDEDTATTSAAGRYATVLDVADRPALEAAVRTCRASAGGSAMAVLVQRMVAASSAGVAFTADPVTGERDVVVVVAGAPGAVTEGGSGQEWRLRPGREGMDRPAPAPACPSAPDAVRAIAGLAVAAADVVGGPADVEWAVAGGEVVILQARPMTAVPEPVRWESPLPGGWLRNFRLGEWLPGPITPLFETWFVDAVEAGIIERAAREAGLVLEPPLHVVVGGWYFHAPLGVAPLRALFGAIIRCPRFFIGGALVQARPEWTDRVMVRRFARGWPPAAAAQERAAERLRRTVADAGAAPSELVAGIDAVADAVAGVFWSISMVGGFAWKVEATLRRLLGRRLPIGAATQLAAWLSQPPAHDPLPAAPHAVQSLDWVHPVDAVPVAIPERPAVEPPDVGAARRALGRRRWRRVERLGALAHRYTRLREEQAVALTLAWPDLRAAVLRLGAVAVAAGAIDDVDDVWFLRRAELADALAGRPVRVAVDERRHAWVSAQRHTPPLQLGVLPGPVTGLLPAPPAAVRGAVVTGQPAGPGHATGTTVVAADLADATRLVAGQVLVAALVTPAWLPVLARAAAVVTDGGTIAAHAALTCRELGTPMVVATGDATRRLVDGETVTVDGAMGTVFLR